MYLLLLFEALGKFSSGYVFVGGEGFERVVNIAGFYGSPGLVGGFYIACVILFFNLAREVLMNLENAALSPQEKVNLEMELRVKQKNVWLAYVLLLAFGFVGAHKFYLGQKGMGFLYAFTFGLLFIGVLVDASRLENKVRSYNEKVGYEALQRILAQRATGARPA